ncbi:MAG TPA: hypothetical protein PLI74_00005 [Candidatus Kapabacteria bacterium]|nr:hypothetical protein [Candidatus Kapabacteria bacterium]HRK57994.1 hypothetical protein [Candidatus Kapabacteria bacterium]
MIVICSVHGQYFQRDTSNYVEYNHNIGLSASSLSGYGLTYRYAFSKALQLQIGGIALQTKEGDQESWFFGSIGTEVQLGIPIKASAFGIERVYAILGASYMYGDNKGYGSNFFDINYNTQESMVTSGIGIGIQTPSFSGFHFAAHGTYYYRNTVRVEYTSQWSNQGQTTEYIARPLPQLRDITVGIGISAFFAF